jgi:hypothetical protein
MGQHVRTRFASLLSAAALFTIVTAGCGSGGPFKYVRASGKITYEDGSPIPGGCRLIFTSQDVSAVGNAYPRPGMAIVDGNGNFDAITSYKYGDGLVPGKHKVAVQTSNERDSKLIVPREYASMESTPLVVDTADSPFDIKVPKPKAAR